MTQQGIAQVNGAALHYRLEGPEDGHPVVFANSLGTDFRTWDKVVAALPEARVLRYDKRGHGLSDDPDTGWAMGDLVADAAGLMDQFGLKGACFVGLSVGGLIAQGLAAERPDLVRLLVLCDTAARIGNDDMWNARIETVTQGGMAALAHGVLERWFTPAFFDDPNFPMWRNMLLRTSSQAYARVSAAIRDTDLLESTARLQLPTMAVVGANDGATPPDLVRETAGLITGSQFHVIKAAGHLPCVDQPEALITLLRGFLADHGAL
ncbi:MAG: 3-oxoadipate enol-lactonase [Pseudomonadota bacterium]